MAYCDIELFTNSEKSWDQSTSSWRIILVFQSSPPK